MSGRESSSASFRWLLSLQRTAALGGAGTAAFEIVVDEERIVAKCCYMFILHRGMDDGAVKISWLWL